MDRKYQLQQGAPSVVPTLEIPPGRWEARIAWTSDDGKTYLFEQRMDIH
jgi:hypothetical protein